MKAIGQPDDGNGCKVAAMSDGTNPGFDSDPGEPDRQQRASGLRFHGLRIGHRSQR